MSSTSKNRYYNPAERVPALGRRLRGESFADLATLLSGDESLFGLYRNQVGALVATHLHSKERMDEMEGLYAPAEGYYALSFEQANEGLDEKIPAHRRTTG